MSTAPVLSCPDQELLEARAKRRPLEHATRLPWQQVAWSLMGGGPWKSEWGASPTKRPDLIVVPCANRVGKSTFAGQITAAHVTGRLKWWQRRGEVWGGMPTLADSTAIMRPRIEEWLGADDGPRWTPREANAPTESLLKTQAGWTLRLKAYEQGRDHWYGGKLQAVVLDEPAPDGVIAEARTRLIDEDGRMLCVFTPLEGTRSKLYTDAYEPWLDYRAKHPGAKWGEVRPGLWVISVGMRDNARSVGGFLPDDRIAAKEEELIRLGRHLEARVSVHGEWLDISEDRLIPVESLGFWSEPPKQGFRTMIARLDPAYTARASSCETAIALVGIGYDGVCYVVDIEHGRWQPEERERRVVDFARRHGQPTIRVQRVGGDIEAAHALNGALMRAGLRACITAWPETGHVPDKVERAQAFAPMVAAGQVRIRPEHATGPENVKAQAAVFSAAYLKAGGLCDTLDAVMGACVDLVEYGSSARWLEEVGAKQRAAEIAPRPWERPKHIPLDDGGASAPWGEVE